MLRYNEIPIEPTRKLKRAVSNFAYRGGGIYRMNVSDFSYYAFTPFRNTETGVEDFAGGWESEYGLKTSPFTHAYSNMTRRFRKLNN